MASSSTLLSVVDSRRKENKKNEPIVATRQRQESSSSPAAAVVPAPPAPAVSTTATTTTTAVATNTSTTASTTTSTTADTTNTTTLQHQQQQQQHDTGGTNDNSNNRGSSDNPSSLSTSSTTLDFIGTSTNAVKDLFALPYDNERTIAVAIHNLGGTLLLEDATTTTAAEEEQQYYYEEGTTGYHHPRNEQSPPLHSNDRPLFVENDHKEEEEEEMTDHSGSDTTRSLVALTIVNSMIHQQGAARHEQQQHKSPDAQLMTHHPHSVLATSSDETTTNRTSAASCRGPPDPPPLDYLSWQFHDMNLLVGSNALIYRGQPQLCLRVEDAQNMQNLLQQHEHQVQNGNFVADHQRDKWQQIGKPSYAQKAANLIAAAPPEEQQEMNTMGGFAAPDLDRVALQTCSLTEPTAIVGGAWSGSHLSDHPSEPGSSNSASPSLSPVSTVLDTYLDNIMANVPQLALCLREKGFIQSVKLLQTKDIPSRLLHPGTLDTSTIFQTISDSSSIDPSEQIFTPQIMEMNAHALLRFLKANCTKDHATYLLRRDAGRQNIQLYDISTISTQRQQKWIWWLAMISYRFANRLRHLSLHTADRALQRSFRVRQRSLLENTLELLETLADMNGNAHESLTAAVSEQLADTFLAGHENDDETTTGVNNNKDTAAVKTTQVASPIAPPPQAISSHQPYANVPVDALNKAQDHLLYGIKMLKGVLDGRRKHAARSKGKATKKKPNNDTVVRSVDPDDSSSSDESSVSSVDDDQQAEPVVTQLYGLHHRLVNISLRLSEIHLKNYSSSSAMQNLRFAAKNISEQLYLAKLIYHQEDGAVAKNWLTRVQLQYAWLWELCGHFARSFAADSLWRDRGHANGDDVVSVLQDVEAAFTERKDLESGDDKLHLERFMKPKDSLSVSSNGMVSLQVLSGIVNLNESNSKLSEEGPASRIEAIGLAQAHLAEQKTLQRDERNVLVAACVAYSRAHQGLVDYHQISHLSGEGDDRLASMLRQRLGDACNEAGKVMLNELRRLLVSLPTQMNKAGDTASAEFAAEILCSSAEFWFREGLASFEASRDLRNLALLRCNLCQCCKLRANAVFTSPSPKKPDQPTHAELWLQEAANHLQAAHEALENREVDPLTWDMVSNELAATFLVLGVRRRQSLIGSGNSLLILQALRLSPGKERSIIDPLERSLTIYEQLNNQHQAAAAHYQLAQFYAKIWTCQRDEAKTREKLAAAFKHYGSAHAYFSQRLRGNETTFCLVSLDVASLYSTCSGEESLSKALHCCFDTAEAFNLEAIENAAKDLGSRQEWFKQMDTLVSSVEDRTFKLLQSLVKLEEESAAHDKKLKELYRVGLMSKLSASSSAPQVELGDAGLNEMARRFLAMAFILKSIQDEYQKHVMENQDA